VQKMAGLNNKVLRSHLAQPPSLEKTRNLGTGNKNETKIFYALPHSQNQAAFTIFHVMQYNNIDQE